MHMNIGCWPARNARIYPSKTALEVGARGVDYQTFDDRINRLANDLSAQGFVKGDRIAALLLNSIEYVELFFACARKGFVLVPLNFRLTVNELAFILTDCTPRLLFYDPFFTAQVEELKGLELPVEQFATASILGGGDYDLMLDRGDAADALDPQVGNDDLVAIVYTGGTTGRAKGVMLTHTNVFFQTINGWALGISPDIVALVVLPLFHVGGLNGSVTPMIHAGATVILAPKFDPADVLACVESKKVNGIMAVPTVYQMLIDHPDFASRDLSSLGVLISGGAPLPHDLIRRYHELGFEMRQGYGLTEASPGVTGMGPGDCIYKPASVGKPCLYTDVEIRAEDGTELPRGEVGEIVARGPNIMKGYWNLPAETAATLRDGWLRTGDLGTMDDEGYVTIVGRVKEMIISGGENIYPAEVEQALCSHPAVAMAAVVGKKDPKWGEIPIAFVMPAPGVTVESGQLEDHLAPLLARYKLPRQILVRPELPLSAAGKILKRELVKELDQ